MITNTGKTILSKYLIGQTPSYASHIAIGCGPTPVSSNYSFSEEELSAQRSKERLDFEMLRAPIISKGYVTEDGVSKVVLTAELPSEERYEITEVGIFSAGLNPSAGQYDSKNIYLFSQAENWEYHSASLAGQIPIVYEPLDTEDNPNYIAGSYIYNGTLTDMPVFQTNADNKIFTNSERVARYERCRFLNNMIMVSGNYANISNTPSGLEISNDSNHLHLNGITVNFDKNSPNDQLKFAFSLVSKDGESTAIPDSVKVLIEFASTDVFNSGEWARFEVDIYDASYGSAPENAQVADFSTNRYFVVTKELQELLKSSGFTWSAVNSIRVYCSVIKDDEPSDDYYVALDALRLENVGSINPLYGMTGYSIIKNTDSAPIVKLANTSNFIEFRFAMDVM
jgi:hypothetical protein